MRTRLWTIASISVLCVLAFVLTQHVSFAKSDDPAKALIALDNDWSDAAVARDVDRVASFYAEDALIYPPNAKTVKGRAAAREFWAQMLADPNSKLSWKTVSAGVDSNTGYTAGTYETTMKAPDGKSNVETGKYLAVWRKGKDGKWKAIHDMWNSDK